MPRPLIQIGDEVREMTADEHDDWKLAGAHVADAQAAAEAAITARASALAKLADLGLTEAEIKALVG